MPATFRHSREGGNPETPAAVIPAQAGIQSVRFQPFPIDSCRVWGLDSRLRGNDGGGGSVFSDRFLPRLGSGFPPARE
ncbi:hypothetical protein QP84_009725 [Neisseria meningitidis]|nr:hypothetical protein QP84_009725 [Neisseria meningitidis]MCI3219272.1 hypothetical protein [Neisseria meningitidis]RNK05143.1 hypothetical protein COI28_03875 [Neisseria meningitidis]RPB48794.1 hypothetical protein JX93_03615 [Neisseria meningitidis]RPB51754.1 hypothetical protein JX96_05770 [Neisseria meningitidis]